MNSLAVMQEMADQVRASTLEILQAAKPQWLTSSLPGLSNHIIWHAGHALWLQDMLFLQPLGEQGVMPFAYVPLFCQGSKAVRRNKYPSREMLVDLLRQQLDHMKQAMRHCDGARLTGKAPGLSDRYNLGGWMLHALHDEARHGGEMYLLYKVCREVDKQRRNAEKQRSASMPAG